MSRGFALADAAGSTPSNLRTDSAESSASQLTTAAHERIGREHRRSAAIGHDGKPRSQIASPTRQNLRGVEQLSQCVHPQNAGPAEGGIVDGIRAGKRAAV